MIRKIPGGYRVVARSGRNMGTYPTQEEAKNRLRQVEFFKHQKSRSPKPKKRKTMARKAVGKITRKPGKMYFVTKNGTVMETTMKHARKSAHSWRGQPRRHSKAAKKGHRRAKRAK